MTSVAEIKNGSGPFIRIGDIDHSFFCKKCHKRIDDARWYTYTGANNTQSVHFAVTCHGATAHVNVPAETLQHIDKDSPIHCFIKEQKE